MKLYPPNSDTPITPHPAKVEEMIEKGYTTEPPKKRKLKKEETEK